MPIRVIIETFSTTTDRNGNRYHAARVTSLDGRSLTISHVGGDRNLPYTICGMGLDHSEYHHSNTTVTYKELKELSKGQPMEHEIRGALWHMLPTDYAIRMLNEWITEACEHIAKAVVAENDGSLPESYRLSMERHGDACRDRLANLAKDHELTMDFPGIFPCFNIGGRDYTGNEKDNMELAKAIINSPCKFAP